MTDQQGFADALLALEPGCPPGLTTWNRSDPGRRFAVHRNNVMASLIAALADTYPVTQELLGEAFFRAMAALFVRAHPPRSRILACYGHNLPAFIEAFPPVAGFPYLADVARLEMLRVLACHAADAAPLPAREIEKLLADETALPNIIFGLHPSLGILRSRHAVVSLWAAHQAEDVAAALAGVAPASAEAALVLRAGLTVDTLPILEGAAVFIMQLMKGSAFGAAVDQAMAADEAFDLAATLAMLFRGEAITSASLARSTGLGD